MTALCVAIALMVILADLASKYWFSKILVGVGKIEIAQFLMLQGHHNRGISFGMLADTRLNHWAMAALGLVALVAILRLTEVKNMAGELGLSLITGGAVANIVDRVMHGAVYDFVGLHVGEYYWPFFNVADACITFGSALLVYSVMCARHTSEKT